jgi:hypothetical protein
MTLPFTTMILLADNLVRYPWDLSNQPITLILEIK